MLASTIKNCIKQQIIVDNCEKVVCPYCSLTVNVVSFQLIIEQSDATIFVNY